MKLICPPPTNRKLSFRCFNHTFVWSEVEESFDAWLEKIARYGRDNQRAKEEWSQDTVLRSLREQLGDQADQYILPDGPQPGVALDFKASDSNPPKSLVLATKLAFPRLPVLAVASGVLNNLTSNEWITVIRVWKEQNPEATREEAGRVWWFILHTLAANCSKETADVGTWIERWHKRFPCKACVDHFIKCPVQRPTDWAGLAQFANDAHNWVTSNK